MAIGVSGIRRKFFSAIGVAALAVSLVACSQAQPAPAPEPDSSGSSETKLRLGLATPTFNTALVNLVMAGDFDRANNLDMEAVLGGTGSANQIAALLAGSYDVVGAGTNSAVDAILAGGDLMIIAANGRLMNSMVLSTAAMEETGVAADAPVAERIAALEGMTIATGSAGSTTDQVLRYILTLGGLDPEADVEIVPVGDPTAVIGGLEQGAYDASFLGIGAPELAVANDFAVQWLSIPGGDIEELNSYVGSTYVTTRAFAEANPEAIENFAKAMAEAAQFALDDPNAAGDILQPFAFGNLDPAVFELAWAGARPGLENLGVFSRTAWDTFVRIFDPLSDNDYASVSYEDVVATPVQGP